MISARAGRKFGEYDNAISQELTESHLDHDTVQVEPGAIETVGQRTHDGPCIPPFGAKANRVTKQ